MVFGRARSGVIGATLTVALWLDTLERENLGNKSPGTTEIEVYH